MKKESTLYENFLFSVEKDPKSLCLTFFEKKFSRKHVLERINEVSYSFKKMGIKENDIVTICLPNLPETIYSLYALNQIGAIANLVHPLMNHRQLLSNMEKVNSKLLIALDVQPDAYLDFNEHGIKLILASCEDEMPYIFKKVYEKEFKEQLNKLKAIDYISFNSLFDQGALKEFDKDYQKDAIYLHSGGTTSDPKTIALSSYAMNALAYNGYEIINKKENEVRDFAMLAVLPIFHGFGLCMGVHTILVGGGNLYLMVKFNSKTVANLVNRDKVNCIIGVPVMFERLLKEKSFNSKKLRHLQNAFIGGDFVAKELIRRFNKRMEDNGSACRLYEGYGLTETVTVATVNTETNHRENSIGKPLRNVGVKIFTHEGEFRECKPNEVGEIYLTGETLMNGYRFEKNHIDPYYIDEDGTKYIKTGDIGYLDEDGFLFFKQRIKRIAKINGIPVYPSEIENYLMELEGVKECAINVEKDERHGNILSLHIAFEDESYKKSEKELIDYIKDKFGVYAMIKKVHYYKHLPKTMVMKIDYNKLEK